MRPSSIAASAVLAALALPVVAEGQQRVAVPTDFQPEECYGVARARQNDCQTLTHSCAGLSTTDRDGASWIYVPAGTCMKLVGGSGKPKT
jgi:uncharacterized membrane protein